MCGWQNPKDCQQPRKMSWVQIKCGDNISFENLWVQVILQQFVFNWSPHGHIANKSVKEIFCVFNVQLSMGRFDQLITEQKSPTQKKDSVVFFWTCNSYKYKWYAKNINNILNLKNTLCYVLWMEQILHYFQQKYCKYYIFSSRNTVRYKIKQRLAAMMFIHGSK